MRRRLRRFRRIEPGQLALALVVFLSLLMLFLALLFASQNMATRDDARAECYRVNFLRYEVDVSRYERWKVERAEIRQAERGRHLEPRVLKLFHLSFKSPTVRALVELNVHQQERLVAQLKAAAKAETFLPFTDCAQAIAHPDTYVPPSPVGFGSLSQRAVRRVLAQPPKPLRGVPAIGSGRSR